MSAARLTVGDRIGRYEIRGSVGGGGMGEVYRVFDPVTRRELALKILKFTYPRALHYFKREFRAVARLSHPNLVGLHDLHHEAGTYFYTMELIDGVDLYHYVNGHDRVVSDPSVLCRPDRLARIRHAFVQLMRALAFLHDNQCIHRDIKPSNVLVDSAGRVKLVDFGIVKELLPGGEGQSLSQVFGTSTYFSPEQSLGSRVTAATDLYAAGVVLYELLAGVPPFEGEGPEVAEAHRTKTPPSLVKRVPGAPPDLAVVCMELLSKDPPDRPSAREALEDLKEPLATDEHTEHEFVGRRDARKRLHQQLEAVQQGHGRMVLIEGESGTGKSALVEAFGHEVRLFGGSMFAGRCVHRDHVPLRGLDTVVERIAEAFRKQTARVLRRLPSVERGALIESFSFLGELLPTELHGEQGLSGERGLSAAGVGLRGLLTELSRDRLLALVVEHAHLADEATFDLLEALFAGPGLPPLMLILTFRPEAVAEHSRAATFFELSGAHEATERVNVGPFRVEETRALLAEQFEDAPLWVADHIQRETGGVPLFVTRMVADVARRPKDPPPTFDDLVTQRIAGLPSDARRVLAAVALSDRPVPGPVLERACSLDADGLFEALSALGASDLVRVESTADGRVDAVPVHARLMAVARSGIDDAHARAYHSMFARALQAGEGSAADLARHWTAAGEPERAPRFARRAASEARAAGDHRRAAEMLALALTAATEPADRARLKVERAESLAYAGRYGEAADALASLNEDDAAEAARWRARRCQLYLMAGDLGAFVRHADELPQMAWVPLADLLAPIDPVAAWTVLGDADGVRADLVRARLLASALDPASLDAAARLVQSVEVGDDASEQAAYAIAHASVLQAQGHGRAARSVVEDACQRLRHVLPTYDLTGLRMELGRTHMALNRGELGAARSTARALLAEARSRGLTGLSARASTVLARILTDTGELNAAARLLAEAGRHWRAQPPTVPLVSVRLGEARLALYRGQLAEAHAMLRALEAETALRPFLERREPARSFLILDGRVRAVRAIVSARGGDGATAVAALRLALPSMQRALPPPRGWLIFFEAVARWAEGDVAGADAQLAEALVDPRTWPDDQRSVARWLWLRAACLPAGEEADELRRQAEAIMLISGVAASPEMAALA